MLVLKAGLRRDFNRHTLTFGPTAALRDLHKHAESLTINK